jgi:hypothetical protein
MSVVDAEAFNGHLSTQVLDAWIVPQRVGWVHTGSQSPVDL